MRTKRKKRARTWQKRVSKPWPAVDIVPLLMGLQDAGFLVTKLHVSPGREPGSVSKKHPFGTPAEVAITAEYQAVDPAVRTKAERVGERLGLRTDGGGSFLKRVAKNKFKHVSSDTTWFFGTHRHSGGRG